jgi:polyphosphate kinase
MHPIRSSARHLWLRSTSKKIMSLIDTEITEASEGHEARIIAKMNSLEDPLIIQNFMKHPVPA